MSAPDGNDSARNPPASRVGRSLQLVESVVVPINPPAASAPKRLRLPSLTTPTGTRRAYARAISWILDGKIDASKAYAIAALLSGINKALELEELARQGADLNKLLQLKAQAASGASMGSVADVPFNPEAAGDGEKP